MGSTESRNAQLFFVDSHQGDCLAGAVARYHVTAADVFEFGFFLLAVLGSNWAPSVEAATRRWIERARHVTGEDDTCAGALERWVWNRHRREQCLGVWVGWCMVQL